MENVGLTQEEELYYANHALIDLCDCCGDFVAIHNDCGGSNYLTWVDGKLYCQKCLK
jgi:hypothetical protein